MGQLRNNPSNRNILSLEIQIIGGWVDFSAITI